MTGKDNQIQYEYLTCMQRHELATTNPDVFACARKDWENRGCPTLEDSLERAKDANLASGPYEILSYAERHRLATIDPHAFNKLRTDWIKRGEPDAEVR